MAASRTKKGYESKNIKRFYVPKTMVIYFNESGVDVFEDLSKLVVEYTKFIQIGDKESKTQEIKNFNRFDKSFYSWIDKKSNDNKDIMNPSSFFKTEAKEFVNSLKEFDLAVVVYKSNTPNSLAYVKELADLLYRNDIFTFHFAIENFINDEKVEKTYKKLISNVTKKRRQLHVPIKEESIVLAYKNANIANRNHFTNLYVNDMIESFISPFLDPIRNPDHFSRIKALFYQSEKNFESRILTSLSYSDDKKECVDLALIQALSNPIFCAAFDASNTFVVNVKMPFFKDGELERINYVLKSVVGDWKQFQISSYTGSFDYGVYCQISIMALNVDESKLITDSDQIQSYVKKIIEQISTSKELFDDKTKTMILNNKIDVLDDNK